MSRSVGVVVPAYRPDVDLLKRYLRALDREIEPEEIRVELDAPADHTVTALADSPAAINAVDTRRGKGAAITAGFEALETDVLAFVDADGSTPAESMGSVVEAVQTGEFDLAIGSRRHPGAEVRSHQTVLRQHLGDVFAWLARRFLSVQLRDYQCGAKALTREAWLEIRTDLYEPGFAWDIEVVGITHARGYTVTEVPVIWKDHPDSTVRTTSAVPELLRALVSVRKRARDLTSQEPGSESIAHRPDKTPLVERNS
ncbi:glycosyltransferase [Halodesulfurarchaeum sp.]|uniref:glycosyltransferase n=1 Tax=Halodesulfurarchaeum sp. TaxID=1980530 RepID=UPI001BB83FC4|nr:glycosyltransferase [Halodesulfurarchaeum sp.]